MKIYIVTSNKKKEKELSKYFKNIGLKTYHLTTMNNNNEDIFLKNGDSCLIISEQTKLISQDTGRLSLLDKFEEVVHESTVSATYIEKKNNEVIKTKNYFTASVEGFLFPSLKTEREDVYNWDEIFFSGKSMQSYQHMKDKGIKNSARDIAFAKLINEMNYLFKFETKVNLNFNKLEKDEVISFESFLKDLIDNNKYYKCCKDNLFFNNLLSNIINDGIFVRRASDKSQRNYWLPGLNAGIPLTPKKDDVHEITFMFHDIMHFIFPDLIITGNDKLSKNKYIISRMMSEAFTIVLADIFFVSILKDNGVQYDFSKRKIYPLFENMKFEISLNNIDKIRNLLWANVCFALLGEDQPLLDIVNNEKAFYDYKNKYQRFFQEDYRWTLNNYKNISKNHLINKKWYEYIKTNFGSIIYSTEDYCSQINNEMPIKEQISVIFDEMFNKIINMSLSYKEYNEGITLTNAFNRYISGQCYIFYKYETTYNSLFLEQIMNITSKGIHSFDDIVYIRSIYKAYLNKLETDNLITQYDKEKFENIFPVFDPFYVFYDRNDNESFQDTLNIVYSQKNRGLYV